MESSIGFKVLAAIMWFFGIFLIFGGCVDNVLAHHSGHTLSAYVKAAERTFILAGLTILSSLGILFSSVGIIRFTRFFSCAALVYFLYHFCFGRGSLTGAIIATSIYSLALYFSIRHLRQEKVAQEKRQKEINSW